MLNKSLYCVLVLLVWQSSSIVRAADLFDVIEFNAPVRLTHPVMALDLLTHPGKELVTLGVDKQNKRWLHLYQKQAQNNRYQLANSLELPLDLTRFDVSELVETHLQSIYFLNERSVFKYNPQQNSLTKLADVDTLFLGDSPDYISRGEFVFDINNDGQNELLLPSFEHISLISTVGDQQINVQKIAVKPSVIIDDDDVRFRPLRPYIVDVNSDGLNDIVFPQSGKLLSFMQQVDNTIQVQAQIIPLAPDIAAIEWWHKRDVTGAGLDQANLTYRRLVKLQDINSDGVLDMIVKATQSSGVLERVNDYQVFFGLMDTGQLRFPATPSSLITAKGTLSGFELVDINADNKLEVILSGFDIGLSQIIGALLSGGIDQDVYIFSLNGKRSFAKKPVVSKEVELSFSLSSGQTGSPVVKLADVNGDKMKDLVLSTGSKRLKVYFATNKGKRRFAKRSIKFKTELPQDGSVISVSDVNDDDKDDLILKFGRLDNEALGQRIKILISR